MSLLPKTPERVVKINEILQDKFKMRFGDYINVRVICGRTDVTTKVKDIARFIFADEDNHMSAVLYKIKSCPDSKKLHEDLMKMENKIVRLHNFKIENGVPVTWRLLRDQSKRLILSSKCLQDGQRIKEDETTAKILKNFPLDFTPIANIDNSETGRIIDLIGLCVSHDVDISPKHDHKKTVLFKNTRRKIYNGEPPICNIGIFGKLKTEITRKNEVYALMNLEKTKYNGKTVIRTTDNTFIFRVTDDNRAKLPHDYESKTFIMNLLANRRTLGLSKKPVTKKSKKWHNDEENNFLMEVSEMIESPKVYIAHYKSSEFDESVQSKKPLKRRLLNCCTTKINKKLCLGSKSQEN